MATPAVGLSKADLILNIIRIGLGALGPVLPGGAVIGALVQIIINAKLAYEAETGQPLDLTKIPLETPVP